VAGRVVGKVQGGGMLKHVDDEQRGPQRCIADAGDVEIGSKPPGYDSSPIHRLKFLCVG
jgi:hypothetical protein